MVLFSGTSVWCSHQRHYEETTSLNNLTWGYSKLNFIVASRRLDVTQGRNSRAPSEDRTEPSVLIVLGLLAINQRRNSYSNGPCALICLQYIFFLFSHVRLHSVFLNLF